MGKKERQASLIRRDKKDAAKSLKIFPTHIWCAFSLHNLSRHTAHNPSKVRSMSRDPRKYFMLRLPAGSRLLLSPHSDQHSWSLL